MGKLPPNQNEELPTKNDIELHIMDTIKDIELPTMEETEISDLQLTYYVRDALLEITGGRENYEEIVGYLQPKRNLNSHDAAQIVATLKGLAGAVSYIDSVHHGALIFALERTSLWNLATYKNYDATDIMDALLELIVSLAALNGMFIDWCLEMLVRHFTAPRHVIDFLKNEDGVDRKNKVLSRVHTALKQISDLVPCSPMRLTPIVIQNIPKRYDVTEHEIVMYVENMLKLESGAIGEIVGSTMLPALVDKLIELDVEIGWEGKMHEDAKCIFEMELFEDIAEFADDDEKYYSSMCASELLNWYNLQGSKVVEKIDSLIALTFLHLESCQSSGRLTEDIRFPTTSTQYSEVDRLSIGDPSQLASDGANLMYLRFRTTTSMCSWQGELKN